MVENFLGEVKGIFNVMTLIDLLISVIYILVGLIFFTSPSMSNTIVSVIVGIILIVNGIATLVSFFKKGDIILYNYNLLFGIAIVLLGIMVLFLKNIITILTGIYFIVLRIQKLGYGIMLKKFSESSWFFVIIMGILFAVIGIISFFTDSKSLTIVIGICLLGTGLINFINTLLLRRRSKYFIA